jgi:hypothetical protein
MKHIIVTDERGLQYRYFVMDGDNENDESVREHGIPSGPPDLDLLDWDGIKRDINNALLKGNVYCHEDIRKSQDIINYIGTIVKRKVIALYATERKGKSLGG